MNQACDNYHTCVDFHAEIRLVTFVGMVYLRIPLPNFFLVDLPEEIKMASSIVP